MALASTSSAQLAYIEEDTLGTTPTTGNGKFLRMTGESLNFSVSRETSKEINASRQVSDSIQVDAEAAGDLSMELSYHEYDPFLEGILAGVFDSTWTGGSTGVKQMTVSFAAAPVNTIDDDGVDGFAGLEVGQWISVKGDSVSTHDGVYLISSLTDDQITVDDSTPIASTGSAVLADISSSRLKIGTEDQRSFSLEKQFTDVDQFFMMKGMCPSKLDLSFTTGSIVTGSIGFVGTGSSRAGATGLPGSTAAAQAYGMINAVTGVGLSGGIGGILLRDGSTDLLANTYIQSLSASVDGALRTQKAIGVLGAVGVATGTFAVSGSMDVYLADGDVYDAALADTTVSVTFPFKDSSNNGYAVTYPNVKLGVPTVSAGSMDSDVILSIPFDAVAPNTSTDSCIIIDRFGVAL